MKELIYLSVWLSLSIYMLFPCGHLALASSSVSSLPLCYFSPDDPRIEKTKEKQNKTTTHVITQRTRQGKERGDRRKGGKGHHGERTVACNFVQYIRIPYFNEKKQRIGKIKKQ